MENYIQITIIIVCYICFVIFVIAKIKNRLTGSDTLKKNLREYQSKGQLK